MRARIRYLVEITARFEQLPIAPQPRLRRWANRWAILRLLVRRAASRHPSPTKTRIELASLGAIDFRVADPEQLEGLAEIFQDGCYRMDEPCSPSTIFDLGANVGGASLYLADRFPEATVYALEPNPATYELLLANTVGVSNVVAHNLAVGEPGLVSMSSGNSRARRATAGGDIQSLPLTDLVARLRCPEPQLIKFDIEGAESALQSDPSFLQADYICGEIHPSLLDDEFVLEKVLAGFAIERDPPLAGLGYYTFRARRTGLPQ